MLLFILFCFVCKPPRHEILHVDLLLYYVVELIGIPTHIYIYHGMHIEIILEHYS